MFVMLIGKGQHTRGSLLVGSAELDRHPNQVAYLTMMRSVLSAASSVDWYRLTMRLRIFRMLNGHPSIGGLPEAAAGLVQAPECTRIGVTSRCLAREHRRRQTRKLSKIPRSTTEKPFASSS